MTAALAWSRERPLWAGFAAALAGAVLVRYGVGSAGVIGAFTTAVLVVLARIDFETHRLPNRIVLPSAVLVLAARLVTDPRHWPAWIGAAVGALACFFVLARLNPDGLGMGDVKLTLLLGAALGGAIVPGLLVGALAGAVAGTIVLLRHGRAARKRLLPYGPFLAFGTIAALLVLTP